MNASYRERAQRFRDKIEILLHEYDGGDPRDNADAILEAAEDLVDAEELAALAEHVLFQKLTGRCPSW